MGFWEPRISYNEALEELPKLLDILERSGVEEYLFHGAGAIIFHMVARDGRTKIRTKDLDLQVFSNKDVLSIYETLERGSDGRPWYTDYRPLFGRLNDEEGAFGMRGIDIKSDHGRIDVRNGLYYALDNDSITSGDRRAFELVCLPREKTGFVCDMNVRLRPYDMLKQDMADMRRFHAARAEHYGAIESELL
jgi:hypothetical protein